MLPIPAKASGDTYTAEEFTSFLTDVQGMITSTSQPFSGLDQFQTAKAASIYSAGGTFYADSGGVNAHILSPIGLLKTPNNYINGMEIRFIPAAANTGASTVNVDGLGDRPLKSQFGDVLTSGQTRTGVMLTAHFDTSSNEFRLVHRDNPMAGQMAQLKLTANFTDVTVQPMIAQLSLIIGFFASNKNGNTSHS